MQTSIINFLYNNEKEEKIKKPHNVRTWPYFVTMVILAVPYIACQIFLNWSPLTDTVSTVLAIIAAVAFWLEVKSNDRLNEAKFVMELNNQFISNRELTMVEWELERYYANYKNGTLSALNNSQFRQKYALDQKERQSLINYLVHLEGIAALINEDVLHLDTIRDLMSYRYFIAVNNPIVQELELVPYKDHYQGCYKIYETWALPDEKIPMSSNSLPNHK